MSYSSRQLRGAAVLRALSHPVRVSILEQLTVNGPMTATQLGDGIDESPANCSWHLRKLAQHGLVVEAEGGTGRARPWRVVSQGLEWAPTGDTPDAELAGEALTQMLIDRAVERLGAARARARTEPEEWREATTVNQSVIWLTAQELEQVNRSVRDLFLAHVRRFEHPEERPEGARLCSLMAWGSPAYDLAGASVELADSAAQDEAEGSHDA